MTTRRKPRPYKHRRGYHYKLKKPRRKYQHKRGYHYKLKHPRRKYRHKRGYHLKHKRRSSKGKIHRKKGYHLKHRRRSPKGKIHRRKGYHLKHKRHSSARAARAHAKKPTKAQQRRIRLRRHRNKLKTRRLLKTHHLVQRQIGWQRRTVFIRRARVHAVREHRAAVRSRRR